MISHHIQELLNQLHEKSLRQEKAIPADEYKAIQAQLKENPEAGKKSLDALMLDKYIALDQDKSLFVYNLLLATGATTVVEIGTSFGVSTIYLALAVAENAKRSGKPGKVIGTEKESPKAEAARALWKQCGQDVEKWIDLKEGDLEQTLNGDLGLQAGQQVDAVLLDIWPYVALPALKLVQPHMKSGAVVIADNTISSGPRYQDLLGVLRDTNGVWSSITLPYSGGLEMSVYMG